MPQDNICCIKDASFVQISMSKAMLAVGLLLGLVAMSLQPAGCSPVLRSTACNACSIILSSIVSWFYEVVWRHFDQS